MNQLVKELRDEIEIIEGQLGDGVAKDYAEYRHKCGVIHGLRIAEQIMLDILDKAERGENG